MKLNEKVSKYLSLNSAIYSKTALKYNIKNLPAEKELENIKHTAINIYDKAFLQFKPYLLINSFYRSIELNVKLKGSINSQHTKGEALDLSIYENYKFNNADLFYYIKNNLEFDQLIWEFGDLNNPAWVHVSIKRKGKNRNEILKSKIFDKKTIYAKF